MSELRQPIDHTSGGAEGDLLREHVFVREVGHPIGECATPVGGAGAGATDYRAGQLGLATEEVREALARLLDGSPLGRRDVDRDAQVDAGQPWMAGLAPGLPVEREVRLQIGDLRRAKPDEDGQSHLAHRRKRLLGVGGHPDGRMRNLVRSGRDGHVLEPVELAGIIERLSLPRQPDDLERFAKARLALAVRDSVDVVRARDSTAADPEVEAALADVIDRRDLLGDAQRVAQRQHRHCRSHAHPASPGRDRAGHLERRRDHRAPRSEVDLAEPDAVEAPRLGRLRERERVSKRSDLVHPTTHFLDEDPDVHGAP